MQHIINGKSEGSNFIIYEVHQESNEIMYVKPLYLQCITKPHSYLRSTH